MKPRIVDLNNHAWSVIERQRACTRLLAGPNDLIFLNPFTGKPWASGEEPRREWTIRLLED
jgi:hypothetical protein